jgi:hypothetical protein
VVKLVYGLADNQKGRPLESCGSMFFELGPESGRTRRSLATVAELEPVRQSGSGPAGPDKTGPDFCQFIVIKFFLVFDNFLYEKGHFVPISKSKNRRKMNF